MRQLYEACITPVMDYGSTVWQNPLRDNTYLRLLETVQRTALIRILSAFRTVSTVALEAESYTLPTHLRLKQRVQTTAPRLSTLPENHPVHGFITRAKERSVHIATGARFRLAETRRTMDPRRLQALETIDPRPLAPWRTQPFTEIEIEPDRAKAKEQARARRKSNDITVFSDASGQRNHLGAAAVSLDQHQNIIASRQVSIGSMEYWSVYAAELMAIFYAISPVYQIAQEKSTSVNAHQRATILSDSMSALQAITNTRSGSGQRIILAIQQAAGEIQARGILVRLQWVPGHCDEPGNGMAGHLAKEAVSAEKQHPFQRLLSRERGVIRRRIIKQWEQEWKTSKNGGHLPQIDKALPSIHARRLYGSLRRDRAYLVIQLRTGHS